MTVHWLRRRRLLKASWWTSAGEGKWLTRDIVRRIEADLDWPRGKTRAA